VLELSDGQCVLKDRKGQGEPDFPRFLLLVRWGPDVPGRSNLGGP
jgi:hypothetical protein